jgi:hypothetical protein
MEKNSQFEELRHGEEFTICPHRFAKGKERCIRPATPHRTPSVSRSDGSSLTFSRSSDALPDMAGVPVTGAHVGAELSGVAMPPPFAGKEYVCQVTKFAAMKR